MSFIRLCTLALIATSSLAACSSYEQANMNNKTSVSQIKDSTAFFHSIKPSHSDAIIGQVIDVFSQDREQQRLQPLQGNRTQVMPCKHSRSPVCV